MKSFPKMIQGTKTWLPPYNNEKYFRAWVSEEGEKHLPERLPELNLEA